MLQEGTIQCVVQIPIPISYQKLALMEIENLIDEAKDAIEALDNPVRNLIEKLKEVAEENIQLVIDNDKMFEETSDLKEAAIVYQERLRFIQTVDVVHKYHWSHPGRDKYCPYCIIDELFEREKNG